MLRLTRTGKIFLVVIVAMHLASITSQSGLLIWLVGLIAGCLAVNTYAAFLAVRNVRLRAPARIFVKEGESPQEPWQLTNTGKGRARLISVECGERVWLKAAEIGPGETVSVSPRDVFKKRGVYPLEDAWLVSLFPFGLVKALRDSGLKGEVLVYPKLQRVEAPEVRGLDPMPGGKHSGPGRVSVGANFAGVRPLQDGDSFKQIHWKSSAKGGGLMVKTFEEELAGRATIFVWCDPKSPHVEACLRAAGALALAGVEAGHQIEWRNLNENRRLIFAPFADTSALLEELARFDFGAAEKVPALREAVRPRVAVHLVLTSLDPAMEAQVRELASADRVVVLHLPAGRKPSVPCQVRHFVNE